jgi:hypothetical protein
MICFPETFPVCDVTTYSGSAALTGSRSGPVGAALYSTPFGSASLYNGSLLIISDNGLHTIRAIDTVTGQVSVLAGHVGIPGFVDGIGVSASFDGPQGLAASLAHADVVYVCDTGNFAIRSINVSDGKRVQPCVPRFQLPQCAVCW